MRFDSPIALLAAAAIALSACSTVLGIDGLVADRTASGGAGSTSTTTTSSTSTSTSTSTSSGGCLSTCGTPGCGDCPKAGIPITSPNGNYAIDPYEVTVEQYSAFLATTPALSVQRLECMWNDSLQPGVISPAAKAAAMNAGLMIDESICGPYFNALTPLDQQKPIVCVDWCDAAAYCTWANKHLCGKIGGGSIDTTPPKDAASLDSDVSEWYRACSNAGANKWPYGNTYTPARCNDEQHGVTNVDKYDQCEGGYPGVFDMSGNVSEWTDECTQYQDPPEGQNCMRRGGAYYNTGDDIACTVADATLLSLPSDNVGFRCCQ